MKYNLKQSWASRDEAAGMSGCESVCLVAVRWIVNEIEHRIEPPMMIGEKKWREYTWNCYDKHKKETKSFPHHQSHPPLPPYTVKRCRNESNSSIVFPLFLSRFYRSAYIRAVYSVNVYYMVLYVSCTMESQHRTHKRKKKAPDKYALHIYLNIRIASDSRWQHIEL